MAWALSNGSAHASISQWSSLAAVPSFTKATVDQAETDRYWNAIVGNGGEESQCGLCKDQWGLSWQITPITLTQAIIDPDPAAARRAFDAMMEMRKIDIAIIEAARRG
jgi:predicted 3-demethylubiquinone-9 3-methyltransferase (glyoxalase superfamily)